MELVTKTQNGQNRANCDSSGGLAMTLGTDAVCIRGEGRNHHGGWRVDIRSADDVNVMVLMLLFFACCAMLF